MPCQHCLNGWCLQTGKGETKVQLQFFAAPFVTANWLARASLCAFVCMEAQEAECGFTCRSVAFGLPEPTFEVVMMLRQAPLSVPARLWGGSSLSLPVAHRQPDRLTLWYLKLVC